MYKEYFGRLSTSELNRFNNTFKLPIDDEQVMQKNIYINISDVLKFIIQSEENSEIIKNSCYNKLTKDFILITLLGYRDLIFKYNDGNIIISTKNPNIDQEYFVEVYHELRYSELLSNIESSPLFNTIKWSEENE